MVSVNGNRLPAQAVASLEVSNASHFTADTYRLELAVAGLPAGLGPDYWAGSQDDTISLAVSLAGETPSPLIVGRVDEVNWDLPARKITLTGRALSAAFIDNKTAEKFQNQTAGQIATTLAARRGLTADVQATTTPAGTYYQIDHAVATRGESEWDLLTYLAGREGCDVWVTGQTRHFRPAPVSTAAPYILLWSQPGDGSFASNASDNLGHINGIKQDFVSKSDLEKQLKVQLDPIKDGMREMKDDIRVMGSDLKELLKRP